MIRLQPLPVPTRAYNGEGIDSYSRRHAQRNHTSAEDIEKALREHGVLTTRARQAPERLEAWRQLGNLHPSAFTGRGPASDRAICHRCTGGNRARGRTPGTGLVCIRHRRWLGEPQADIRHIPTLLTAERQFRKHLAGRGITTDSYAMTLGRECAILGIGRTALQARAQRAGTPDQSILLYPEQVALARLLTRPRFIETACEPDTDGRLRHRAVERAVLHILPETGQAEPWRAVTRIWAVATILSGRLRESRLSGSPMEDHEFNLLRHDNP